METGYKSKSAIKLTVYLPDVVLFGSMVFIDHDEKGEVTQKLFDEIDISNYESLYLHELTENSVKTGRQIFIGENILKGSPIFMEFGEVFEPVGEN